MNSTRVFPRSENARYAKVGKENEADSIYRALTQQQYVVPGARVHYVLSGLSFTQQSKQLY